MIGRLCAVVLLALALPATASAQLGSVPYTFSAGTTISSSNVNAMFAAIYANACNRTACVLTGQATTLTLLPTADNASDLGSAALSYRNAWIDGTLTVATLAATSISGTISTTGRLTATLTTEQIRAAYDGSNYLSITVASNGATTIDATGSGGGVTFSDVAAFVLGITERSRSVALGEWANHAYSAGDYTQGSGTWTVDAGDVTTNRYTMIGKTVIWQITLATTTTATTPSSLRVALPNSLTAATLARSGACGATSSNGAATEPAYWNIASSGTYVSLYRSNAGTWDDGTDNTSVACTITFEIA